MNKHYETLTNTRGDSLPGYRAQVVVSSRDSTIVPIYADNGGTRFRNEAGEVVNYAIADREGMVEFYWDAVTGHVLQTLDPLGGVVKSVPGFADNFASDALIANLSAVLDRDFTGSPGANVTATGPAVAIPAQSIPLGTRIVTTTSYAGMPDRIGLGRADMGNDSLCTSALAAQHPLAVKADRDGTLVRLLPDAQGFITVEQLGCPTYAPGVNAQPYIQAAISYANAMKPYGIKGVAFGQEAYELWAPLRNADQPQGSPGDLSGFPCVVRKRIGLRAAPNGTTFIRRKFDGSDPNVFAGTQQLANGKYWRGGMFLLAGQTSRPTDYSELAGIDFLGRWMIRGGVPKSSMTSGTNMGGNLDAQGRGWDYSDKPLWWHNDLHTGDVTFEHLEVDGFRGELVYQGGSSQGSLLGRRLILSNTDGDGFNPSPHFCSDGQLGRLEIEHVTIHHAHQALEGGGGIGQARIGLLEVYDCDSCSGLNGGRYLQGPLAFDPTPSLSIDKWVVKRCGPASVLFYLNIGELVAYDTTVHLGAEAGNFYGTTLGRLVIVIDKVSAERVLFRSLSYGDIRDQVPQDSYIGEITHIRTPFARANGRTSNVGFTWAGGINLGANVRIGALSGEFFYGPGANNTNYPIASYPILERLGGGYNVPAQPSYNAETTPVMPGLNSYYVNLVSTATSGNFPVTLPSPTGKFGRGARIRLLNGMTQGGHTVVFSVQTANLRNVNRRLIIPKNGYIEFESDGNFWNPVTPSHVIRGNVTTGIAANTDSTPVTVAGAAVGMEVRVVPQADNGGAQVIGRVTASDTVVLRNVSATAASSVQYLLLLEWAS